MNIRKPTDYTTMFAALDVLMAAQLPQMELYCEIGRVVSGRAEKGAAVAASEYREAIYGLKEPPQEETVEIIRMSEVDTQTVEWLWEPYIPFGKVTIVQGNPSEGKTTFALRLAAACTTGGDAAGNEALAAIPSDLPDR